MAKVEFEEYEEIRCNRVSCGKIFKVKGNTTMIDGYHGICTCPYCGKKVRSVKTKPTDDLYNILRGGQRIRKIPKAHLSKKQRKKLKSELKK